MTTLDKERLLEFLRAQAVLLAEGAWESRETDGTDEEVALRMDGGVTAFVRLRESIESGLFDTSLPSLKKVAATATPKVRHRDPHTSYSAAVAQTPERSLKLYQAIRIVLTGVGPMTDEELHDFLQKKNFKHTTSGLRTRRSELADAGWVRDSGNKRPTAAGSPAIVWEFAPSR